MKLIMNLADKTETRILEIDGTKRAVTVVKESMTKEEARQMYPYRPFNRYSESRFGGNTLMDDTAILLNDFGNRCKMCRAPTIIKYLKEGICPDCDGRAEYHGKNPRV